MTGDDGTRGERGASARATRRRGLRVVWVVLVVAVVGIGALVAFWPAPVEEVRITSVDAFGMCAEPVGGGAEHCWRFGPELAKEAGWAVGRCAEVRYGYRFVDTPHVVVGPCPATAGA